MLSGCPYLRERAARLPPLPRERFSARVDSGHLPTGWRGAKRKIGATRVGRLAAVEWRPNPAFPRLISMAQSAAVGIRSADRTARPMAGARQGAAVALAARPASLARARSAATCNLGEADFQPPLSFLFESLFRLRTRRKFPVMRVQYSLFLWKPRLQPADCKPAAR